MDDLPTLRCPFIPAAAPVDELLARAASVDLVPATWQCRPAEAAGGARDWPPPNPLARVNDVQPTWIAVWRTERALHLYFYCVDADIQHGPYNQDDDPLYDGEVVEAFLCPTGDLHHYFEIEVNPANLRFHAAVQSPDLDRATMRVDAAWNPELATEVYAPQDRPHLRWTVSVAIPFADLGVAQPQPGDRWRANFYRIDRADPPEFSAWSPTGKDPADFHVPERFGWLEFV